MLERMVGADADKVLAMYRNEDPTATPFIINARIITDTSFRRGALHDGGSQSSAGERGRCAGLDVSVDDAELRRSAAATVRRMASMYRRRCTTFAFR